MAQLMFYTDFVATAVYGGQPDAPTSSMYNLLFDEGVRMGSWGLLLHSITGIHEYIQLLSIVLNYVDR